MGKDLTEIVFILDRSGSMSGLEADTIGGFNSMIQKQKKSGAGLWAPPGKNRLMRTTENVPAESDLPLSGQYKRNIRKKIENYKIFRYDGSIQASRG